ncbi:MAG TPA: TetR/AcrR family transcriptional regulator, partial [Beijerinckiaceae bacterium]
MTKQNTARSGDGDTAVEAMGQRERNKADKLRRIKDATYELFTTKGFDETTTREIALRAGVGLGTVFTYADNKRDLLFLVANDDLEAAMGKARDSLAPGKPLAAALIDIFRPHYAFFARQPALSRLMLREMTFYDAGAQAARFKTTRENLLALIRTVVKAAKAEGSIASSRKDEEIAWVMFCIYQVELRRWVAAGKPSVS